MSVSVICDICHEPTNTVWGVVSYSPGGGRHGTEEFHFCYRDVALLRDLIAKHVKSEGPAHGRWMIFDDAGKDVSGRTR